MKIITPALTDESRVVPTAPITNAGPAFTELNAILMASLRLILFFEYNSDAKEHPTGKPEKRENKTAQPA